MSPFRPANLNKRIVSSTGGNGGVIGTTIVPYLCGDVPLGCRCLGGCRTGRFNISESFCGVKECCGCQITDCKGFHICRGSDGTKWFVAPSCTQVSRTFYSRADAVTVANSCMGSCGWFVPDFGSLQNPGYCCRAYWDSYCLENYWSDSGAPPAPGFFARMVDFSTGSLSQTTGDGIFCVRVFRCTAS